MAISRSPSHTIATELGGGYQVVATDVNADGRIDLVALASRLSELVWFENPGWARHVIAEDRSGMINLAAHDLDGDGIPEIASGRRLLDASRTECGYRVDPDAPG